MLNRTNTIMAFVILNIGLDITPLLSVSVSVSPLPASIVPSIQLCCFCQFAVEVKRLLQRQLSSHEYLG